MKNTTTAKPEPCEICGAPIIWVYYEAKDAKNPQGPTHCCPSKAYDEFRKRQAK